MSESKIGPLEDKLKQAEEKLTIVVDEKIAAQADAVKWKKRSDPLETEKKHAKKSLEFKNNKNKMLKENVYQCTFNEGGYRSKLIEERKKNKELTAINLKEDIDRYYNNNASSCSVGGNEKLNEAHKLLEQSHNRIKELEKETEELKKEKEEQTKKRDEKETRAKLVLSNAKDRIVRVEIENKELKVQMESFSSRKSNAVDGTPRLSVSPTVKRARDSTAETEKVSDPSEEGGDRASGQQKKTKSEGH